MGFDIGAALTSWGGSMRDFARNESERRQQAEALKALAQKSAADKYVQDQLVSENARRDMMRAEAEGSLRDYTHDINAMKQTDMTRTATGGYPGPISPTYAAQLTDLSKKSPLEQMAAYKLPAYTEIDPRIKGMVGQETTGAKLLQAEKEKEAQRQFTESQNEAARLAKEEEMRKRLAFEATQNAADRALREKTADAKIDEKNDKIAADKAAAVALTSDVLGLTNDILNDPGFVTGLNPMGLLRAVPGTKEFAFKQKVDNLISKLSLEEREKLRGTGQISDNEQKMLRQAVTMLGTGLDKKSFIREINRIQGALQHKIDDRSSAGGGNIPRVNSDAEYNALPAGAQYIDPNGVTRRKK